LGFGTFLLPRKRHLTLDGTHSLGEGLLRSGVRFVVYDGELCGGELGVALCGGEAFVAKEFLDGAEVGAFFEEVGAEGVAQGVWMDVGG